MAKVKLALPPLVFGNSRPKIDWDLDQMLVRVNSITNWVSEFDFLSTELPFQHRTSALKVDDLRMMAVSSTPTVMKVYSPDCTIAIAIEGVVDTWIDNKLFKIDPGKYAVFYPKGKRHTEGLIKTCLLISISEESLNKTAKAMLGDKEGVDLDLNTPRRLSLKVGKLDFTAIFIQTAQLIDQFKGDELLLKSLGIDDSVYRILVMMLRPELFLEVSLKEKDFSSTHTLDLVCEYIQGNLNKPISLTTLEALSGISARTLQLAFIRKFACTPMDWVKAQRLAYAHQLLLSATSSTKIGVIAATCGYSNFGDFSRYYAKRYNELPSETLAKALKGH
jgi:AraC-like DNA-binding protein